MTVSIKKHAIALSDKEFALLETINKIGPCTPSKVKEALTEADSDIINLLIRDLSDRGLLIPFIVDGQQRYAIKPNYANFRQRMIVMESF